MRRTVYIFTVFLTVVFMLSGCADLKDKFVRKKKEPEKLVQRYQPVRPYDVRPTLELYTKRYVFWKNWHRELLDVLNNSNHKKITVAVEQEISSLYDMKGMLIDEKGDELQKWIDKLTAVESALKKEKITKANEVRIRRQLETIGRQIKKDFSYNKVRGDIRNDFRRE
ncbi:MAG: hypothetical protein ABH883_05075 [Candidatus Omnitrophota bacterium]